MLRYLYVRILALHPAVFRHRFGSEMLDIFDDEGQPLSLVADGFVSLFRQWAFRGEYRRPIPAGAIPAGVMDVPYFQVIEPYKPRPRTMVQSGLLAMAILIAMISLIG
ncbi:MAG: hypothetical protein HYX27_18980 [Acidobacteria bacterium]|nr:hypothetical protein [Acidobacteriota bacterium]